MITRLTMICCLFVLLWIAPAAAQSDAELRDRAATFGLTPAQADALFSRYVRQQIRMRDMAARSRIDIRTLRAAAIELGADSTLSDQDFLRLVEGKAKEAQLAQEHIEALSDQLARLDPSGIRTRALVVLARGEAAFRAGQLDDAAAAFKEIEALRLGDLANGHDAWIDAVFAHAEVTTLAGDRKAADVLYDAATVQADQQAAQSSRDGWSFQCAKARQWFEYAQISGDLAALTRAENILNQEVIPRAPRAKEPLNWARTQWMLGALLTLRGQWERDSDKLNRGIAAYDFTEGLIDPTQNLEDWAGAQAARAAAVIGLSERALDPAALDGSLKAMRRAISLDNNVLSADARVALHGNMAIILQMLGSAPVDFSMLHASAEEFGMAIAAAPASDSSMSRGRIGLNYCNVATRLGAEQAGPHGFDDAIRICKQAMDSFSAKETPYLYGVARLNWGNALLNRAKRTESAADLTDAQQAFSSAREQFSRADHPSEWSKATLFLAQTQIGLGGETGLPTFLDQARLELGTAAPVIASLNDPELQSFLTEVRAMLPRSQ